MRPETEYCGAEGSGEAFQTTAACAEVLWWDELPALWKESKGWCDCRVMTGCPLRSVLGPLLSHRPLSGNLVSSFGLSRHLGDYFHLLPPSGHSDFLARHLHLRVLNA